MDKRKASVFVYIENKFSLQQLSSNKKLAKATTEDGFVPLTVIMSENELKNFGIIDYQSLAEQLSTSDGKNVVLSIVRKTNYL